MNGDAVPFGRAIAAALVAVFIGAAANAPSLACGWAGENDGDDDIETVTVDAAGWPVADDDDPISQNALGNRYRTGDGVAVDHVLAARWYRAAAEGGLASAQNNLATMYEQGLGVAVDLAAAAAWFRRAADQGEPHAQHSLGSLYHGNGGIRRDASMAAAWFRRAADQGHQGAAADLAALYATGDGVPGNKSLAYMWWRVAAELGDPSAGGQANSIAATMTPGEAAEGERLVVEWRRRR